MSAWVGRTMPTNDTGISEITAPIDISIVGDRLHVVLHSGPSERIYSVSFHKARKAIATATRLLDEHARELAVVKPFKRKRRHH